MTLGEILDDHERVVVPQPVKDYCTSRVLTMDLLEGRKITDLGPLAQLEVDGPALAEALVHAYLDQMPSH